MFGVLLGVALLAAGAGAWLLGTPAEDTSPRVLGANQPVNAGALERRDISANNSPSLARNPTDGRNLVVSNRIDLPRFSCALHASFDGGATWAGIPVPFPAGEEDPPRCYAPDVAYAPDGTLHMSFVTLKGIGNVPNAVWTVSSKDGGRTLSTPVRASGPLAFQVQLTADARQANRLYLNWLQAEATGTYLFPNTGNPIVTSTSIDGGATWSAPTRVTPPDRERVVAPSPALGPNGELYVLYLDLLDDRLDYGGAHEGRGGDPYDGAWALVLARSTDQGVTWEETLVDAEIRPTERFIVFLPPTPALAVDAESGRIHVGFTDGRHGDADVHVWTSTDGGRTFGPPKRVNDTPLKDGTAQYMPRLDLAPGGRLDVVYFDRRADLTNIFNEVSLQASFDGGRTFTKRVRVSDRPFDSRIGFGSERLLPDLGSRLALLSTTRRALAIWPDTRGGTELTRKQDLASAVVDLPKPVSSPPGWLRPLGAGLIALGLLSLVLGVRSRGRTGVVRLDPSVARPGGGRGRRQRPAPPLAVPAPTSLRDSIDRPVPPGPAEPRPEEARPIPAGGGSPGPPALAEAPALVPTAPPPPQPPPPPPAPAVPVPPPPAHVPGPPVSEPMPPAPPQPAPPPPAQVPGPPVSEPLPAAADPWNPTAVARPLPTAPGPSPWPAVAPPGSAEPQPAPPPPEASPRHEEAEAPPGGSRAEPPSADNGHAPDQPAGNQPGAESPSRLGPS